MGRYLPASQAVDKDGLRAKWSISYLGRSYGQVWDVPSSTRPSTSTVLQSAFGVTLLNSVDAYREADRALKYAILFIALTFAACLMFEFVGGTRPSVAQYGLIGLSLCVFYLLLLSLTEQIGFGPAYLVSAVAVAAQAAIYNWALQRRAGPPWHSAQSWPGFMVACTDCCSSRTWRCWRARCSCSPCCRWPCGSPAICIAPRLPEPGKLAFHKPRRNDAPAPPIPECRCVLLSSPVSSFSPRAPPSARSR
jgi:hypothetical protein